MATLLSCDDGEQPPWCPASIEDTLPHIVGSLPEGPAWDADRVSGTTKNNFWRAIADITAWTYRTLCAYEQEFYCDTADLSLDQWNRAFAVGESCDPYGFNLCAKVTSVGGQDYAFFTDIALKSGYVIECGPIDIPEPIAGCFEIGCTPLGPAPVLAGNGSNLGYGALCGCDYGEIIRHPDPEFWANGTLGDPRCPVPGSDLGDTSGSPDGCFIVGYYEAPAVVTPAYLDACNEPSVVIRFPAVNKSVAPLADRPACDSSGRFSEYGHAFVWKVTIDVVASNLLRNVSVDTNDNVSNAGNLIAGCTSLCAEDGQDFIMCLLDQIKPAHTEIWYEVIQP